ncbi:MAG: micrococcal nuclease-like nuclease [Solidesulfovibrio magneticus str. Maddingley MBC34]|uniref:Micrococcal nuclease-like nuclease n=1 Tax=Solidesulfovibrio magneticus str. Maddingley MBC34 TaxID=1206767 RepID=K6HEC0_9BACT|nr:MAG: micrococcal nuclease-like nuclease [Solidesulfovibrio magneticus str. Maddingley MBC34]
MESRTLTARGGRRLGAVLALVVICLIAAARAGRAADETVRSVAVYDGDTCRLADGRTLRLAGVDAPETAHDGRPAQYYAQQAKAALEGLVRGVPLRFVGVGPAQDRFGRLLGDLVLPDGRSVTETLLSRGCVFVFWHKDMEPAVFNRLLALQRRAIAERQGFWPRLLSLPPPAAPYVGNASSHRFHAPSCPDAARIGRRNRVALPTIGEALDQGYAPARDCTPWP